MALTGLAIAAALGLAKSELIDKPQAKKDRKLAAETQRLSPWTGLEASPVKEADPFGTALQFGAAGAQMGQGYKRAELDEAMANRLNTGGSLVYGGKNISDLPTMNKADAMPMTYGQETSPWGSTMTTSRYARKPSSW